MGSMVQEKISNEATELLDAVCDFWNNHIHDWMVARSEAGTPIFFSEIATYRFEDLHYLPRFVNFDASAGKKLLEIGCGVANGVSRSAAATLR